MKRAAIAALTALLFVLGTTGGARAQRLLDDWLVRTGAGPAALQTGPTAALWNPAGVGQPTGRGSAVLLELLAPEATGVTALALSGGWRLDGRTAVAGVFQHFAIEGVERTETEPEGGVELDIAQDLFVAAAARSLSDRLSVGGAAQYVRSSAELDPSCAGGAFLDPCKVRDQLSVGVGFRWLTPLPVPLTAAGYAYSLDDRILWGAATEVAPKLPLGEWNTRARLGASGGRATAGVTYRGSVAARWRDMVELEGGLVAEPDAGERQWEPQLAAAVRLYRYELGVVREWLPNAFGAVHTFRFGVTF